MIFHMYFRCWKVYRASVVRLALNQHGDSDIVVRSAGIASSSWDFIREEKGIANPETVAAYSAFCSAVNTLNESVGVKVNPHLLISPEGE